VQKCVLTTRPVQQYAAIIVWKFAIKCAEAAKSSYILASFMKTRETFCFFTDTGLSFTESEKA